MFVCRAEAGAGRDIGMMVQALMEDEGFFDCKVSNCRLADSLGIGEGL